MEKAEPQELGIKCDLNRRKESILTFMANGENGPTLDFECSKATIEDGEEGYKAICNFTEGMCPLYEHLLKKARQMFDPKYKATTSG